MRWWKVALFSVVTFMSAVSFVVVLNEPWLDNSNICEVTP